VAVLVATALPAAAASSPQSPSAGSSLALRLSGAELIDGSGAPIRLVGVDHAGTEFACVQGHGIFDGRHDAPSIAAMASWQVNVVRVPLNEDCWLGINGVPPDSGGIAYQTAIKAYVALLHQAGLYVILDLHWTAPGGVTAVKQLPMPDADHAPAFWSSVATTFRADPAVVFDLFNEPFPEPGNSDAADPWSCWRDGCTMLPGGGVGSSWRAVGIQQLVDAVRSAGANQVLLLGGVGWAGDLSGWLGYQPRDAQSQLAASFHVYNFTSCINEACWASQIGPVAASVPVVAGEIGENDCSGSFINRFMAWADTAQTSYLAWTWNTWDCGGGPALISSYDGVATGFGAAYQDHLNTLAQQPRGVGTVQLTWASVPHRR
jgi:hypothetical protein